MRARESIDPTTAREILHARKMTDGRTETKVVVLGSACVDLLMRTKALPRPGVTELAPTYELLSGGKGANQAHACAMASAVGESRADDDETTDAKKIHTEFVGAVGADEFGEQLRGAFRDAGVGVSGLRTHDKLPTACAAVIVDEDGENQIAVGSGANGAVVATRLREAGASFRLNAGDVLLQQMEIPAAQVFEAVDVAHEVGAFSVLNVAPSAPVPIATLRKLDFLIVNEHECADVHRSLEIPQKGNNVAQAAMIAKETGAAVIVTLGAEGAAACFPYRPMFETADEEYEDELLARNVLHVNALDDFERGEEIVDTTGAGDAFCGAFCAALAAGLSMSLCLQRASVAGALACTKVGARAGVPSDDEIARRLESWGDCDVWANFGDDDLSERKRETLLEEIPASAWARTSVAFDP